VSPTAHPPRISAEAAAALVRSGDWVDYGANASQPDVFDRALAARVNELAGVKIRSCVSLRPRAVVAADPTGEHFAWLSWHFSPIDRAMHDQGRASYIPMNFGEAPDYYRRFLPEIDVACLKTAPMDAEGNFNFGSSVTYLKAVCERAKLLIVETSPVIPPVYGSQECVNAADVDYVIEGDAVPLTEFPQQPPTDADRKVAALIAAEVPDGACLQVGIGGMPNAVCAMLADAGVRDLGIHTEMFCEAMIGLCEKGVVTGARKQIDRGRVVYTFAGGSQKLYQFIRENPALFSHPVDYTNDPAVIARNDNAVAINNTTQVDLQGQMASESSGFRHISGTGGQLQFARGAYASKGGKSFLCLSSVYERHGRRASRIVAQLTPGNIVTTPRTDVMYVVTEYGIANLKGLSVPERAVALIGLAHPDFREELSREAREKNIVPRAFWPVGSLR
jgi:acyl-CoA hydrolase